ncbi:DUF4257 domain-containing protein [Neobacillus niacini]|uniref:DUF4257 domain-containing protein n=1 Tax=Neobacillus niacini TaxID=86668 RepID=UPI00285EFF4B|nr:DUF4257 domain-containing protein [Neobacillus niacini]MDR6997776.1 hypothetical protein [Neobacillus niacini]
MLKDIIFSFVIGGVVGMIGHIRKHGKIIMPRKTKRFVYLGFFEEMLLGAIASLLLVVYISPNSYVEKMTISISAGIGGDLVLTGYKQFKQNDSD